MKNLKRKVIKCLKNQGISGMICEFVKPINLGTCNSYYFSIVASYKSKSKKRILICQIKKRNYIIVALAYEVKNEKIEYLKSNNLIDLFIKKLEYQCSIMGIDIVYDKEKDYISIEDVVYSDELTCGFLFRVIRKIEQTWDFLWDTLDDILKENIINNIYT